MLDFTQLLHKPNHECGIVLYGSTGEAKLQGRACTSVSPRTCVCAETLNEPHNEAKLAGDDSQYLNIHVLRNLAVPNKEALAAVQSLQPGTGEADFTDALAVVMDMYIKADTERVLGKSVSKRVVFISNFYAKVS